MVKFKADVDFQLKNSDSLLNLKADFYLGENKISLEELKKYAQKKEDFIARDDGTLLKIENEAELERLVSILNHFKAKEEAGVFEGKLYHATELQEIFTNSEYYQAKKDAGFEKFLNDLKNYSGKKEKIGELKIPEKFQKIFTTIPN
jgi:glycogen debranching enzyme